MSTRIVIRGLVVFASLVALGALLKTTQLGAAFDEAWIDAEIRGRGLQGQLLFVAAGWLFTAVGLPRQLVGFLAGYAFGFVYGTGLALAATALGCATTFFYARFLARDLVARRFPARVRRIDDFLSDNPLAMTLLIRFLPVGSNLATNLAAGVSRVGATPFVVGSAVGYVPQTLVFALAGSGISLDPGFRITVSALLFLLSGILGVYLYRRHRRGKTFDDALERELGVAAPGDGDAKGDARAAGTGRAGNT